MNVAEAVAGKTRDMARIRLLATALALGLSLRALPALGEAPPSPSPDAFALAVQEQVAEDHGQVPSGDEALGSHPVSDAGSDDALAVIARKRDELRQEQTDLDQLGDSLDHAKVIYDGPWVVRIPKQIRHFAANFFKGLTFSKSMELAIDYLLGNVGTGPVTVLMSNEDFNQAREHLTEARNKIASDTQALDAFEQRLTGATTGKR
jgi:hypothetical protein